jgi:hypothetical protein
MEPPALDFDQVNKNLKGNRPFTGDEVFDPREKLTVGETPERRRF